MNTINEQLCYEQGWRRGYCVGALCVGALWLMAACHTVDHNVRPPTDHPSGCGQMCANLERLGCPSAEGSPGPDEQMGTPDDESCKATCESLLISNPTVDLHLVCQMGAQSCSEADACFQ